MSGKAFKFEQLAKADRYTRYDAYWHDGEIPIQDLVQYAF